uniref:Uncharacterized protein n=1 Tax=Glossina pallidipes TaxID=7398 RepID=A0A1A9ZC68_GLOPL
MDNNINNKKIKSAKMLAKRNFENSICDSFNTCSSIVKKTRLRRLQSSINFLLVLNGLLYYTIPTRLVQIVQIRTLDGRRHKDVVQKYK